MRDNALYFPYINAPNSEWFFKILLYWEKVSSIVPSGYIYNPQKLEPQMREFVSAELVHQVFPAELLYGNERFENSFISFVNSRLRLRQANNRPGQGVRRTQPIHIEKLGKLGDELVRLGVARARNYPWFDVDEWVGDAFMAYLASVLGSYPEVNAAPVTNRIQSFQVLGGLRPTYAQKSPFPQARRAAREIMIKNLLPTPKGELKIQDIVDFKSRYGHLLPRLRNLVENRCIQIAQITDLEARQDQIELFLQEFEVEIGEITEAMKRKWSNVIFKTLVPLLTGVAAVTSGVAGAPEIQSTATTLAGSGTLLTAIQQAIGRNDSHLSDRPIAYAAHARLIFSK